MYNIGNLKFLILLGILFLLVSCHRKRTDSIDTSQNIQSKFIIGSQQITNEIAGSAYIKTAKKFFVINENDTSSFQPILSVSKERGVIQLDLNIPYNDNNSSFRKRMKELKLILPEAKKDFNFDSLSGISVGRLIRTGDLAIEITGEYLNTFGGYKDIRTSDYQELSIFLLDSKLTSNFDSLLKPYDITVSDVQIEKAFFSDKKNMLLMNTLEADTSALPKKILDCITWLDLKKSATMSR